MPAPKRVLCIMDHSGLGRASLGVVGAVLSACGVQACCLPMALFSTHTGGFAAVVKQDVSGFAKKALAHYAGQAASFDAVYIGYLCGAAQFALAAAALRQYPGALHVVDPAMADDGKTYSGIDENSIACMRALCKNAWLITPNHTESMLLLGRQLAPGFATPGCAVQNAGPGEKKPVAGHGGGSAQPGDATQPGSAQNPAKVLAAAMGAHTSVLITSAPAPGGASQTLGYASAGQWGFAIANQLVAQRYPGTGDIFCAAVLGLLLAGKAQGAGADVPQGAQLESAALRATQFVQKAAFATYRGGGEARHGIWFERFLPMLWQG